MASYGRRGAPGPARGQVAPCVAVKRMPPLDVGERAPLKRGTGGTRVRVSGLRAHAPRLKLVVAAVVAVVAVAGFIGGLSGDASAEPTVQAFLLAWGHGRYPTAAEMTTGEPATVTTALRTAYQTVVPPPVY